MYKTEKDGVSHLNIYSKAKTDLGQFLSNFAYCPIVTEDGPFNSIEGYWYWLSCKDDRLREAHGYQAKHLGRELGGQDWQNDDEFKRKIIAAIELKLQTEAAKTLIAKNPELLKLKFVHYYVYGSKTIEPKDGKWIIEKIRSVIK